MAKSRSSGRWLREHEKDVYVQRSRKEGYRSRASYKLLELDEKYGLIKPGEELTFNYGYDLENYREHPCRCGTSECVGYIVAEELFEHVRQQRELRQE